MLLPSAAWQLLRTWGWAISFPDDARPAFGRLFRVRLAADAISFFTVRGVTGEPLKVLLLLDRCPPQVTTAAIALERLAVGDHEHRHRRPDLVLCRDAARRCRARGTPSLARSS